MSRSDAMRLVTATVVLAAWAQTWAQTKTAQPTRAEAAAWSEGAETLWVSLAAY